jgi:hypothetical protein
MLPNASISADIGKSSLLNEANLLRRLFRVYRADREFLKADSRNQIVMFLDSNEVTAYVDPDAPKSLEGFFLRFEALEAPARRSKVALRHDQILNGLLFDPRQACGILTSHTEEMEREVEFRHAKYLDRALDLVRLAGQEIRGNRERAIRYATAARENPMLSGELIRFVQEHAPALIAILKESLTTAFKRMRAILNDSELTLFDEMPWTEFGVASELAKLLNGLEPTTDQVIDQRSKLRGFDFRQNTLKANYIDASALAQLKMLRTAFETAGVHHLRAVLVTRAQTLLRAAIELARESNDALLVRHPRMLALSLEHAATLGQAADLTLGTALDLWRNHLQALPAAELDPDGLRAPLEAFTAAWDAFESSRLAVETRWRDKGTSRDGPPQEKFSQFLQDAEQGKFAQILIDIFCSVNPEGVLKEHVLQEFVALGREASKVLLAGKAMQLRARISRIPTDGRVTVTPLAIAPAGPIQLAATPRLTGAEGELPLEEIAKRVASQSEQPLLWALSLACVGKWRQAGIFAESALKLAALESDTATTDEAHLLRAEIRRLGADAAQPDPAERFRESSEALAAVSRINTARRDREAAAQLVEAALHGVRFDDLSERLRGHFRALDTAVPAVRDPAEQSRCIALLLMLYLYDRRYLGIHGRSAISPTDARKARELHRRLVTQLDLIPHRARAMALIFYTLLGEGHPLPEAQVDDLTDLQRSLMASTDRIGQMLQDELVRIRERLAKSHQPVLSLVPFPLFDDEQQALQVCEPSLIEAARKGEKIAWKVFENGPDVANDQALDAVIRDLTAGVARLPQDDSIAAFVVRSWLLYARLLQATMEPRHVRRHRFDALRKAYEALSADYPNDLLPLIRLSFVGERLDDQVCAQSALERAMQLVRASGAASAHQRGPIWINSLIRRRYGIMVILARCPEAESRWTKPLPDPEAGRQAKILAEVCDLLFLADHEDAGALSGEAHRIERERRVNNIVFYGSRLIERFGEKAYASVPKLRSIGDYAAKLVPSVKKERRLHILHTIGCFYAATGNPDPLYRVAKHMIEVGLPEEDTQMNDLRKDSIEEIFTWFKDGLTAAVKAMPPTITPDA